MEQLESLQWHHYTAEDAMLAISFPVTSGWNNRCDCGTYTMVHILKVIIACVKNGGHKIDHNVNVNVLTNEENNCNLTISMCQNKPFTETFSTNSYNLIEICLPEYKASASVGNIASLLYFIDHIPCNTYIFYHLYI